MLVLYGADVMIEEGDPERQGGRGTGKASFFGAAEAMGGGADSSVPMSTSIVRQARPSREATHTHEASTTSLLPAASASCSGMLAKR